MRYDLGFLLNIGGDCLTDKKKRIFKLLLKSLSLQAQCAMLGFSRRASHASRSNRKRASYAC
jgi:hypothetical protein